MKPERRAFTAEALKIEEREGKPPMIRGHAAVFNALSSDLGGFREKIMPGAFRDTIANDDVVALFNHDANHVLGRRSAGTLTLSEDEQGLAIEIEPPDTQLGRDLVTSIRRGDVSGMSFGFRVAKNDQTWERSDPTPVRTLKKVQLLDVSPVTFPAYPQTDVAMRSLQEFKEEFQRSETSDTARKSRMRMRVALASRGVTV